MKRNWVASQYMVWIWVFWLAGMASCTAVDTAVSPPPDPLSGVATPTIGGIPVASTVESTATAVPPTPPPPTDTPFPPPSPTPSADITTLQADILAELPVPTSGNSYDGFGGITTLPLTAADGRSLWAVYTFGARVFDPWTNHFVAIYAWEAASWQLQARLELEFADFIFEESARQVVVGDGRIWLELSSGAGAHGGCYDLLLFDGLTLTQELNHCHSNPLASQGAEDINGDAVPDLVLNQSNDYVFCYACGVRIPGYRVLTWNGTAWEEVTFRPAPDTVPEAQRTANDTAVALAQAGLWQDAEALMGTVTAVDPILNWNHVLLTLYTQDLRDLITYGSYPLLNNLFYGDYPDALESLRPYAPADLFAPAATNPLLLGTVADGWATDLAAYIATFTEAALTQRPDLAGAYFLRGWAVWINDPANSQALADINQAATLTPDDPLFTASAAYLRGE